jgi:hypothetical protein
MASKISSVNDVMPVIDMAIMGASIAQRKTALGITELPRNSGERRTKSKKALLKAIADVGGKW